MVFGKSLLVSALLFGSSVAFVQQPRPAFGIQSRTNAGFQLSMAASVDEYKACEADLKEMIDRTNSNPIMIRLAWHDSGTYNKDIKEWPACGGADGSIRFSPEIDHGANAGLKIALGLLKPIKEKHANVGWADLMQMASAVGVELAGGPKIPMKYGRVDIESGDLCPPEGNLPDGNAPFGDGCATPQDHLRKVFNRMGFNDQEIVALSGAHTLGRAWKNRSGTGAEITKFTQKDYIARGDNKPGIGSPGGSPWTEKWLKFDNSYFATVPDGDCDPELLKLQTDEALFQDPAFLPFAQEYKNSQEKFFEDYAKVHAKLSELGSKFEPAEGVTI